MPINVEWDNPEHTISRWTYTDSWTWDEFCQARQTFHNELGNIAHPVDIIADMSRARGVPPCTISPCKCASFRFDSRRNRVVFTGCSSYMRSMATTLNPTLTGNCRDYTFANTLEEARVILGAKDAQATSGV